MNNQLRTVSALAALARCQWREAGTERPGAKKKPRQAESSNSRWFQAWVNRSYPEGKRLLLWIRTKRVTLAVLVTRSAQRKTPKGGTKWAHVAGRKHSPGKACKKPSERPAMLKTAPLACDREATWELRGQTRGTGPTHRQKWWQSQRKLVKTRRQSRKRVLTWFASRRCKRQLKRAKAIFSICIFLVVQAQGYEYSSRYFEHYCSGDYARDPSRVFFCQYFLVPNGVSRMSIPTIDECVSCKKFLERITWNQHTEKAVENLLTYTTNHFCEKIKRTTQVECKRVLTKYRPQMRSFLTKIMQNGTFCEILLKCHEKRGIWFMSYFHDFNVDFMSFYPMQFFEYFFNIENYSKDFYPYYFFSYFYKHQYEDFFPYSDFEYFFKDAVYDEHFSIYNYEPYQYFDYFFNNQTMHFKSHDFDLFSFFASKPNNNGTFCSQCVNIPDTQFQRWLQSIDLKRFTEVGYETFCGEQKDSKQCVLIITQIVLYLKAALETSVTKETICYRMFRCPRDIQPVVNQEFHFFSDFFHFGNKPEVSKCTFCESVSEVFQEGIKSPEFHRYVVNEFEKTYCNKIFSDKAQCEQFLNNELENVMKKVLTAIENRQLCRLNCDDLRNVAIRPEFYEYFFNSNDRSCLVCKAISQLLKKQITSRDFERAVYHKFEVEKCKTLFPENSQCVDFLNRNFLTTASNISKALDEHEICNSSCKARNDIMYFPFRSYYEKPQNNCAVCEDLIGELINYKPDNTNIESIMENLCLLFPATKAEYCTEIITQYKTQIKELVIAHKSKNEVCQTINQCSSNPEFFDFFKTFFEHW
jgi:hypothetical protein